MKALMPEVAHPGKYHGDPGFVGGLDYLGVSHRAARLNNRRGPCRDSGQKPVREREERIGRHDRALRQGFGKPGCPSSFLPLAPCYH